MAVIFDRPRRVKMNILSVASVGCIITKSHGVLITGISNVCSTNCPRNKETEEKDPRDQGETIGDHWNSLHK